MSDTILAIDFGTSNSLVGAYHQGHTTQALALDPKSADPTLMRTLMYFPHADLCITAQKLSSNISNKIWKDVCFVLSNPTCQTKTIWAQY